jgi:serine/threonine protein kinase
MVGPKLDRYRIIESIGAGGMGEVYLARDERLERNVALKVLPSGILSDENARKRFRKEALTLSQLNHPNIATVFDFDSQDGVDFLVMEYVPGQTLDDRLNEGPLSEKEIALLGGQLVDGLAAAHSQNVVHRDLKPANLRVTPEGRLKILDFGLAKLVRPVSESLMSLTMEGGISGTLPYMAPEQLREEPVDGRTDLHAAGAVLYEFATGERPFQATKHAALIYSILSMDPPPPRKVNSKVPRELETVILKALEKAPGDRYQTANELGEDLNRWSEGTGVLARSRRHRRWKMFVAPAVLLATVLVLALNPGGIRDTITGADKTGPSIAILPCVNISGNPDEEYFADGMTDDLINQLSGLGSFSRVISTTTMLSYKGKQKTPKEIAEELQVSMVLSARVRQEGGMIHLSTQLIDPKTDEVLWGEKYVRNTGDVYALQGEVSQEVARALDLPISQNELRFLQSEKTVSPDAYRALKRGQEARRTPGADGSWLNANLRAVGFFQEAVGVAEPPFVLPVGDYGIFHLRSSRKRRFITEN